MVDSRALGRVSLILGTLVLIVSVVVAARNHVSERNEQLLLVAALSAGVFLTVAGLASWLSEKPIVEAEEDRQLALALAQEESGRTPSVSKAVSVYLLALSAITAIVVGVATGDTGAGIQTFTFGLILSGVIWGLGVLLGYRPAEE